MDLVQADADLELGPHFVKDAGPLRLYQEAGHTRLVYGEGFGTH